MYIMKLFFFLIIKMSSDTTLVVHRLSRDTTKRDVEDLFVRYGPLKKVVIKKNDTALVEFDDPQDARDALALDGHELEGSRIVVEHYGGRMSSKKKKIKKEYNNDEIMEVWLEQNPPDEEDNVVVKDEVSPSSLNEFLDSFKMNHGILPLSFNEFLDWIKVNHGITFIFYIYGLYISLSTDISSIFITAWSEGDESSSSSEEVDKTMLFETKLDINTDNKTISNIKFESVSRGERMIYKLAEELKPHFDSKLKSKYTRGGKNIERTFTTNSKQWKHLLERFFNLKIQPNFSYYSGQLPEKVRKNGEKFKTVLKLTYSNVSANERMMFANDQTLREEEIRNELNRWNNFGYYNMNVLSVKVKDVYTKFKSKGLSEVTIKINVIGELIKPETYYITIGEFRNIWENICVNKRFSPAGLSKIAKELGIDLDEDSDHCQVIGEAVNNLTWANFAETDEKTIVAYVEYEDENDNYRAVREMNGKQIRGGTIKVKEYGDYTIEISNLPANTKKHDIENLFEDFGVIKKVSIV